MPLTWDFQPLRLRGPAHLGNLAWPDRGRPLSGHAPIPRAVPPTPIHPALGKCSVGWMLASLLLSCFALRRLQMQSSLVCEKKIGRAEEGKRAGLLSITKNPMGDVSAFDAFDVVIVGGRVFPRSELPAKNTQQNRRCVRHTVARRQTLPHRLWEEERYRRYSIKHRGRPETGGIGVELCRSGRSGTHPPGQRNNAGTAHGVEQKTARENGPVHRGACGQPTQPGDPGVLAVDAGNTTKVALTASM